MSQSDDQRAFLDAIQEILPLSEREAKMIAKAFDWKCAEIEREDFPDHQDVFDDIAKHVPWFGDFGFG